MHEWALAESVLRSASEHAGKAAMKKVTSIEVVFGELQDIDREIFGFATAELVKHAKPPLATAKIKIIDEEAGFSCRACGKKFNLKAVKKTSKEGEFIHFIPEMAHTFIKCPKCKSPDFDITAGRGVYIRNIKGTK